MHRCYAAALSLLKIKIKYNKELNKDAYFLSTCLPHISGPHITWYQYSSHSTRSHHHHVVLLLVVRKWWL